MRHIRNFLKGAEYGLAIAVMIGLLIGGAYSIVWVFATITEVLGLSFGILAGVLLFVTLLGIGNAVDKAGKRQ